MRILIVDDESLNRFLLIHMLEQEGYSECYEATNGDQALSVARQVDPDLVLLDVVMPDMSGYEVAPKLKALSKTNYLPIIFITSLEDRASLIRCLEVGGDDFVAKPFDRLVLAAKIRAHGRIRSLNTRIEQQNAMLLQHQQAMDREHEIVDHIFKNAIRHTPEMAACFDFKLAPAEQFNGDVFLTEKSPSGGAYYLIGDFTGHGLASAIGVLPVARAFHIMAEKGLGVAEMARTINATLLHLLPANMFLAAIIAEISDDGCQQQIWHGGMPQILVKRATNQCIEALPSAHMALGILAPQEFESHCITLECNRDDQLLLCTDGLIEITNSEGVMLNEEGVEQWFAQPDATASAIHARANQYTGCAQQQDDMTVVIYTCQPFASILTSPPDKPALPLTVAMTLAAPQLKDPDIMTRFVDTVCQDPGMAAIRSRLFTVLSELYSNALEHGVLRLDSNLKQAEDGFIAYYETRAIRLVELTAATIHIKYVYDPDRACITLTITDTGDGFDLEQVQKVGDSAAFGRGLPLIFELCDTVQYSKGGREATVTLLLPWAAALH